MECKHEKGLLRHLKKSPDLSNEEATAWAKKWYGDYITANDVWRLRHKSGMLSASEQQALQQGRRRFMLGAGALTAVGIDSILEFSGRGLVSLVYNAMIPESVATPETDFWYDASTGRIYIGKPEKDSPEAKRKITNALLIDFHKPMNVEMNGEPLGFDFKECKSQTYVMPLKPTADVKQLEDRLREVKIELARLGLDTDYQMVPVHSVNDISHDVKKMFVVGAVADDLYARLDVIFHAYNKSITFKAEHEKRGEADKTARIDKGKISLSAGNIYIGLGQSRLRMLSAVFNEILHNQLIAIEERVANETLKYDETGKVLNLNEAQTAGKSADESVVHGICLDWLRENRERFGISPEEYADELKTRGAMVPYKGALVIKDIAAHMGRRAFVKDCLADPVKYWKLLQERVQEYRDLK